MFIPVQSVLSVNLLAVKTDESEPPALLGPVVLGNVGVTNAAVLLKETLEILSGGAMAQTVNLEADHLGYVRRRTLPSTSISATVSVRHFISFLKLDLKSLKYKINKYEVIQIQ